MIFNLFYYYIYYIMDEINEQLLEAVKEVNYEKVEELLEGPGIRANVNFQESQYGESALMIASQIGLPYMIRILLRNGADINLANKSGNTALVYGAIGRYGEEDQTISMVLNLLMNNGADIYQKNNRGNSPLSMAKDGGFLSPIGNELIISWDEDQDEQSDLDEPSDPDIDLLRDEAARYIQTIMRARIETDKKRKLTKRRYGKWASPKTKREKDRRYMDLIRQIDNDDPMKGYERYAIYPERLLPHKKGGKRNRKYYTLRMY